MNVSVFIPKGFKKIAVRDTGALLTVIYYHPKHKRYMVTVNDVVSPIYTIGELKEIAENINDVVSMRGHYTYLDG